MNLKLNLSIEGATALREWADGIWLASDSIRQSTDELLHILEHNQDALGVHASGFAQLFLYIQKYQEQSAEAIEALPEMLHNTADKIEMYIHNQVDDVGDGGSNPGWHRVRTRKRYSCELLKTKRANLLSATAITV